MNPMSPRCPWRLGLGTLIVTTIFACTQPSAPATTPHASFIQSCDTTKPCEESNWICDDHRCIPSQLTNNPFHHREPLYFVWTSFERVKRFGSTPGPDGRHHCPGAVDGRVDTGVVPALDVHCARGPEWRCVPDGDGPAGYSAEAWKHPAWRDLGMWTDVSHRFHYRLVGSEQAIGSGQCSFTVQAFGDLDDDGVFSTFERSGMFDATGMNAAVGLYIDVERQAE